jgi:hypothetical protein
MNYILTAIAKFGFQTVVTNEKEYAKEYARLEAMGYTSIKVQVIF